MSYIVNSSPAAGLRYEPSSTFPTASAALACALSLELRGMRQVRIKETETGKVFDQAGLRTEIERVKAAEKA